MTQAPETEQPGAPAADSRFTGDLDIVVCGLSGQGVILTSRILSTAFTEAGLHVKLTEVPGIKHRYTLTSSFIRIGADKHAPRITEGEAQLIVGFEPFETLRMGLRYCRPGASVVYNSRVIETRHITSKTLDNDRVRMPQPDDMKRYFSPVGIDDIRPLDATRIAIDELGNVKAQNVIMVGAAFASGALPVDAELLEAVIQKMAPRGTSELNLAAFRRGVSAASTNDGDQPRRTTA